MGIPLNTNCHDIENADEQNMMSPDLFSEYLFYMFILISSILNKYL